MLRNARSASSSGKVRGEKNDIKGRDRVPAAALNVWGNCHKSGVFLRLLSSLLVPLACREP